MQNGQLIFRPCLTLLELFLNHALLSYVVDVWHVQLYKEVTAFNNHLMLCVQDDMQKLPAYLVRSQRVEYPILFTVQKYIANSSI